MRSTAARLTDIEIPAHRVHTHAASAIVRARKDSRVSEREMRRLMTAADALAAVAERVTVAETGGRLIPGLEALGRRPTTLRAYRSALGSHPAPALGDLAFVPVEPSDVERFIAAERPAGVAPKTTLNALPGLAVRLVDALERDGHVTRARGTADRRTVRVTLTGSGRRLASEITTARLSVLQEVDALSLGDRAALNRISATILARRIDSLKAAERTCRLCEPRACGHPQWCPVTHAANAHRSAG